MRARPLAIILPVLLLLSGAIPRTAAADVGPYLFWDESGSDFKVFGPNQPVTISSGQIKFLCDQFFPTADIYVVADAPALGEVLDDVSPSPNTVFGASGGLIVDETIGFTVPSGQLTVGWYTVVYDECQDGVFGSEDTAFVDAFYVDLPAEIPAIDPSVYELKSRATGRAATFDVYGQTLDQLDLMERAQGIANMAQQCLLGEVPGVGCAAALAGDIYADLLKDQICSAFVSEFGIGCAKQMARDVIADNKKHWEAIAADPPDPAFAQATTLGPVPVIPGTTEDPVAAARGQLGDEVATESAISGALLHAIERYQGAAGAGDGRWALGQARQARELAGDLRAQLDRVRDAASALSSAILAHAAGLDAAVALVDPIQDDVAANGFSGPTTRALRNLGLGDAEIANLRSLVAAANVDGLTASAIAGHVADLATASSAAGPDVDAMEGQLDAVIAALEADGGTPDDLPVANPGGPYAATESTPVVLDGSASTAASEITSYAWDLDRDGAFDDATGPTPTVSFPSAFDGLIGLRVTDRHGYADATYTRVVVGETNRAPHIVSTAPGAGLIEVVTGSTTTFSVAASDPDGDSLTTTWLLDDSGAPAGSGASLSYTPTVADVGVHTLTAAISDGRPDGGTRLVSWRLLVRARDGDGDLWTSTTDCDDANPSVNPGRAEIALNGLDDDCNPATDDAGSAPVPAFVVTALGGGRNVALRDVGPHDPNASAASAVAVDASPTFQPAYGLDAALDLAPEGVAWEAGPAPVRYGVVRLWGSSSWLVDRIAIMPRFDLAAERVADFAVDVSTTGFANESDWTQVLAATAANSGTLQEFVLPGGPVPARYVRVRLITNRGAPFYISVSQFKVYSPQESAGTSFDFADRSTDVDNDITARLWTFGDGATSTATAPSHTFGGPGARTVTLQVSDSQGHVRTSTMAVRVTQAPLASAPVWAPIDENDSIGTNGSSGSDPDGGRGFLRGVWDWGDGMQSLEDFSSGQTHRYPVDGTYTVRLTVTDDEEQTGFVERTLVVRNVAPSVTLPDRMVIGGQAVAFSGSPTDPADPLTCSWDFGDGSATVAGCSPKLHIYPAVAPGAADRTYTQTLRVSDDDVTTTRTATITVTSRLADRLVSDGLPFTFDPPAALGDVNPKTCSWDFGDGSAAVVGCGPQRHTFPVMTPGAPDAPHAVRLTVASPDGTTVLQGTVTTRTVAHVPVYHTDFETAPGAEWSGTFTREPVQGYAGYGGSGLLLRSAAQSSAPLRLTLTGLPAHNTVSIRSILAIIDSWDGVGCFAGPDTLTIRVDGTNVLSAVFENSVCGTQTYLAPPNVTLVRHLGMGFADDGGFFNDSAYNLQFDPALFEIPHTGSTLTIEWFAGGVWQGINDESFGLDNLDVVLNGVPGDTNHAPSVDAGGPYTVTEGSTVTLTANGSDADSDPITYAWDLDGDGQYDDATGLATTLSPDDGPAALTVGVRASDGKGGSATASASVTVQNALPFATISAPTSVGEGASFTVALVGAGDASNADSATGFTYAFDCGFGAGFGAWGASASASCTSGDDDVDPTVRARIRDKDGGTHEETAVVSVANTPPSGTFGSTSPIDEGGSSTLAWSGATDPSTTDAAALRYSFACDGLLTSLTGAWASAGTVSSTTCTFDDNGDFGVVGRVLDPDNASQTTGGSVTVRNVAPTATFSAPASLDEGASFTVGLSGPSDASAADRAAGYTYAFDCGAGFGGFGSAASATCTANDDGALTVGGRIRDKDGGVRTYTSGVTARNVAPTASASNDGPAPWGIAVGLHAGAGDVSPADRASLTIDWDLDADGAYDDASGANPTTSFGQPGSHPVAVRVCDDHVCTTSSTTVSVVRRGTSLTLGGDTTGQYSDPAGVSATIRDRVASAAVSGLSVQISLGTQSGTDTSSATGVARPAITLNQVPGTKTVAASFAGTALYEPASATGSYVVTKEDAVLTYAGDTLVTGTSARLAASATETGDATKGDISRAQVTFDVYTGATACGSGTPATLGPIGVMDVAPAGDGDGVAETSMATPAEQVYCIVARLAPASNAYYRADPAEAGVLTVVSSTGKFATGGGWIVDPDTQGHGNFGLVARFTKPGQPKGQAVYVWRAMRNGQLADFIVKSSSITGLSFADEAGNGSFPWRATLTGKATLRINRASDGAELVTDGNATFTLVAVDGTGAGAGSDRFAIQVLDKSGAVYKLVGTWAGSSYRSGIDLAGGNVKVHME